MKRCWDKQFHSKQIWMFFYLEWPASKCADLHENRSAPSPCRGKRSQDRVLRRFWLYEHAHLYICPRNLKMGLHPLQGLFYTLPMLQRHSSIIFVWYMVWKSPIPSTHGVNFSCRIVIFNFNVSFEHLTLLKWQKGCGKWILQKILHRYSDSKKKVEKKFELL